MVKKNLACRINVELAFSIQNQDMMPNIHCYCPNSTFATCQLSGIKWRYCREMLALFLILKILFPLMSVFDVD